MCTMCVPGEMQVGIALCSSAQVRGANSVLALGEPGANLGLIALAVQQLLHHQAQWNCLHSTGATGLHREVGGVLILKGQGWDIEKLG